MLRVQHLDYHNFDSYHRIVRHSTSIGLANELRVLRTLWSASDSFQRKFTNTTLEYEIELLESFQAMRGNASEPKPMTRVEVAAHLRFSEKQIVARLRQWIRNEWLSMIDLNKEEFHNLDEFVHVR